MKHRALVGLAVVVFLAPALGSAQNLITNGDFESLGASWTEWSTGGWTTGAFAHDYASGVPIWNPSPYPYAGTGSHGQHVGTNNVHGGIYQVINVTPGLPYSVSGMWSGGIGESGSLPFTVAWFEVTVYQGAVAAAEIDAPPGPDDVEIAKREYNGDSIISFPWEPFSGSFVAQQPQVTLAFKTGKVSPNWHPIAAFHDDVVVQPLLSNIPTAGPVGYFALVVMLAAAGFVLLYRRVG